jgi:hypothetical protein
MLILDYVNDEWWDVDQCVLALYGLSEKLPKIEDPRKVIVELNNRYDKDDLVQRRKLGLLCQFILNSKDDTDPDGIPFHLGQQLFFLVGVNQPNSVDCSEDLGVFEIFGSNQQPLLIYDEEAWLSKFAGSYLSDNTDDQSEEHIPDITGDKEVDSIIWEHEREEAQLDEDFAKFSDPDYWPESDEPEFRFDVDDAIVGCLRRHVNEAISSGHLNYQQFEQRKLVRPRDLLNWAQVFSDKKPRKDLKGIVLEDGGAGINRISPRDKDWAPIHLLKGIADFASEIQFIPDSPTPALVLKNLLNNAALDFIHPKKELHRLLKVRQTDLNRSLCDHFSIGWVAGNKADAQRKVLRLRFAGISGYIISNQISINGFPPKNLKSIRYHEPVERVVLDSKSGFLREFPLYERAKGRTTQRASQKKIYKDTYKTFRKKERPITSPDGLFKGGQILQEIPEEIDYEIVRKTRSFLKLQNLVGK